MVATNGRWRGGTWARRGFAPTLASQYIPLKYPPSFIKGAAPRRDSLDVLCKTMVPAWANSTLYPKCDPCTPNMRLYKRVMRLDLVPRGRWQCDMRAEQSIHTQMTCRLGSTGEWGRDRGQGRMQGRDKDRACTS